MLAGLRSRWMIPCSCAASSASAICLAMGRASSSGSAPRAMPLRQILTLDQFHDQRPDAAVVFEAVDVRDVRVVQRRQRLGFAGEPRQPFGVAGEEIGQHLDRDIAVERRVARPIDLAHPAGAEEGRAPRTVRFGRRPQSPFGYGGRYSIRTGPCWPARQRPSACRHDDLAAARLDRQPTIEAARRMAIHPAARTLSRLPGLDRQRQEIHVAGAPEQPFTRHGRRQQSIAGLEHDDAVPGCGIQPGCSVDRRIVVAVVANDEAASVVAGIEHRSEPQMSAPSCEACGRRISSRVLGSRTPRPAGSPLDPLACAWMKRVTSAADV